MPTFELDLETPMSLAEVIAGLETGGQTEMVYQMNSLLFILERRLKGATREDILAMRIDDVRAIAAEFTARVLRPGLQSLATAGRGERGN